MATRLCALLLLYNPLQTFATMWVLSRERRSLKLVPSDILSGLLLVSSTEDDLLTHAENLLLFIASLTGCALCHFERMIPGTSHFQKFKI